MGISLRFLGAAGGVTGSQYLLTVGDRRILIDCGLFQGGMEEIARNRMGFAYPPDSIDAVLLTHAHNDHVGRLPALVRSGFQGPVYATSATGDLAEIVLTDSAHLQAYAAERWARHHPEAALASDAAPAAAAVAAAAPTGTSESAATELEMAAIAARAERPPHMETRTRAPLFDVQDVARTIDLVRPIAYAAPTAVVPGIEATFHDAGHILGSAIIEVTARDADGSTASIVFSGDLGRTDTPILRDPAPLTHADYVIVESTYGDREHGDQDHAVGDLVEVITDVARSGGVLLIPAFAIGRTQHLVWVLDSLVRAGRIPRLPLFIDSPMACEANGVYYRHTEDYDPETLALLQSGDSPLQYPGQACTSSVEESKAIIGSPRPFVLVAASGMLTGGRILHHLKDLLPDQRATLLFIGYQGEGTLGRHLQDGGKEARIDGASWPVRCRIRTISGFSAHADMDELDAWIRHFGDAGRAEGRPRVVYVTHGEPTGAAAFATRIHDSLGVVAQVPALGETVTLNE
ncbi:MAG: MBL fold metallo-hydrolase RNA specificity domain-containing protein [Candidatus Limnocylindria bacterium]